VFLLLVAKGEFGIFSCLVQAGLNVFENAKKFDYLSNHTAGGFGDLK
jgi:hypothetical protein